MMPRDTFRVGITPDCAQWTNSNFQLVVAECLGALPNLECEVLPNTEGPPSAETLNRYDAIIAFAQKFPAKSFAGVSRLVCISRWGVGFDYIDVPACTAAGVLVALAPEAVRRPMAEGILAMIFHLSKNLRCLDLRVREGRWRTDWSRNGICVAGRTLGSVGAGNIARELFRLAKSVGFGRLLSFDPFVPPEQVTDLGVDFVDLETLLRESDFVAVNVPLNSRTRGLIGARELALMKRTAYLVNTSRGSIVDEKALAEALRDGRIAGAGLDVFEQEPPPSEHSLYEVDNVILTPHSVGCTEELIRDLNLQSCLHVKMVYDGQVPPFLANPEAAGQPSVQRKLAARARA